MSFLSETPRCRQSQPARYLFLLDLHRLQGRILQLPADSSRDDNLDDALKEIIRTELAKKKRQYAQLPDVAAILCQESHGVPYFAGTEPLYRANLNAASKITGLTAEQINQTIAIPSGEYKGHLSKFRCEPDYWNWAKELDFEPPNQFLLSCSIGVGQKMTRYYVSAFPQNEWIPMIQEFMGDVPQQVLCVCNDIDQLLIGTKGDRPLSFTRYNAGPSATKTNPRYTSYGLPVAHMAKQFAGGHDPC
jgi:hypothetical protein